MAEKKKSPFLTTGERVRNFLGLAFVLSLLIHAVILPIFPRMNAIEQEPTPPPMTIQKVKIKPPPTPTPTPKPTPTPTPPPHPTPAPPQQPQEHFKPNLIHTHNTKTTTTTTPVYPPRPGTQQGTITGVGTASPNPGTPGPPACRVPYADATSTDQVAPDYPPDAKELGLGDVTVLVQVTVGPTGSLEAASIYQSSHNGSIDREALRAARESRYSPKIVNCSPVSGTYLFRADFTTE